MSKVAIICLLTACAIVIIYMNAINKRLICQNSKDKLNMQKMYINNIILSDWLEIKNKQCSFDEWFLHFGIKHIAIYGYGVIGKALYNELKDGMVEIVCIADKNAKHIVADVKCVTPNDIPEVDAIVVTAVWAYDEIEMDLLKKYKTKIMSVEEVLYGLGVIK